MNRWFLLFTFYFLLFTCLFTGCAKKKIVKPPEPIQQVIEKPAEEPSLRGKEYKKVAQLDTVYFDYDDATLRSDARNTLAKNASWLKDNPDVEIIVEGHCDERGTTDYNIALGDRRAKSVRSYLMKLGVKGNRIATISYGEEKPVDFGHDETAWSKNRRAEMLGRIPEKPQEILNDKLIKKKNPKK
ncbi:MAG: peptidoglycan-associated lipoprotein Pal [Elusimicrobia bacterium]|nr:peptidoglycan-associated lipoprotein Pal [Elusimicrobiota bacterium]